MLENLVLMPCRKLPNARGYLQEILRGDQAPGFAPGQVYVTCTHQGIVKAWYKHRIQFDTFFVLQGVMRLVLLDDRRESASYQRVQEIELRAEQPQLLKLPPGIWHGFQSLMGDLVVLHMNSQPFMFEQPDEERVGLDAPGMPACWSEL